MSAMYLMNITHILALCNVPIMHYALKYICHACYVYYVNSVLYVYFAITALYITMCYGVNWYQG